MIRFTRQDVSSCAYPGDCPRRWPVPRHECPPPALRQLPALPPAGLLPTRVPESEGLRKEHTFYARCALSARSLAPGGGATHALAPAPPRPHILLPTHRPTATRACPMTSAPPERSRAFLTPAPPTATPRSRPPWYVPRQIAPATRARTPLRATKRGLLTHRPACTRARANACSVRARISAAHH